MTTTLPAGLEYKTTGTAPQPLARRQRKNLGSTTGEWGSDYPEEHGVRNAIVAVTGVRDEVGDIIVPGAFKRTLAKLEPKMCLGHDWNRFVGDPIAYEELLPGDPRLPKKDRLGRPWNPKAGALCTRNRYLLDTPDGKKAYSEVTFQGSKAAFSIGYVPIEEKTWKAVDPDSGLFTRYLGDVDLYEYGPVLHGAHPMAGVIGEKSARPDLELKATRLVRDSAFWGLPIGTPIRLGMKPQGPKARRLANAGKPVSDTAGAVELDPNEPLRIKPTAKGKLRAGKDGALLWDMVDEIQGKFDDEADPYDPDEFEVDDTNAINKGEMFNPLDVLVANAMTPADLDEYLRQGEWDSIRVGDAEERRPEIDSFIDDVVASYRDKYNRELVKQNSDKATEEIPRERGDDPNADAEEDLLKLADGRSVTEAPPGKGEAEAYELVGDGGAKLRVVRDKNADPSKAWGYTVTNANGESVDSFDAYGSINQAIAGAETEFADAEGREAPSPDATPGSGAAEPPASEADMPAAEAPQQPAEPIAPEVPAVPAVAAEPDVPIAPETPAEGGAPDAPLTAGNLAVGDTFVSPLTGDTLTVDMVGPGRDGRIDVQASGDKGGEFNSFPADQEMERPPADQPDAAAPNAPAESAVPEESAAPDVVADESYVPTGNMNAPERFTTAQLQAEVDAAKELKRELIRRRVPANSAQLADAKMRIKVFEDEQRKRVQEQSAPPAGRGAGLLNGQPPSANLQTLLGQATQGPDGWVVKGHENTIFPLLRAKLGTRTADNRGVTLNEQGAQAMAQYLPGGNGSEGGPPSTGIVPDGAPTASQEDNPLAALDEMALETELTESRRAVGDLRKRNSKPGVRPNTAAMERATERMNLAEAESNRRQDASTEENRRRTDELIGGNRDATAVTDAEDRRWVRHEDDGLMYPENPDLGVQGGLTLDELGVDHGPLTPDEPAAGAAPEGAPVDGPPAAATAENAARITADEIADVAEVGDASFGIAEAPDGEFEADPDVADRQDRLAALLIQDEAGTLDLSNQGDDQLRATRADLVTEIRLQEHLETRVRRDSAAPAGTQRDRTAADAAVEEPATEPEDTGPKPRPGVAGAAQDLADALDSGDDEQITRARARLDSSLNRSRSDSEQVQALRALLGGGQDVTPEDLRAAADAIKAEQRAKRNESAKSRRLVRRLERERLRSLLGTVEATMRNRGIQYDAVPESAPVNRLDRLVNGSVAQPAPTWQIETTEEAWSGFTYREHALTGTGYQARVIEPRRDTDPAKFEWTVTDDDGNTIAQGSGEAADIDAARTAVEVALDVQHTLGLLPADSQPPAGNLPTTSSATSPADIDTAVATMRQRITEGRKLNPLTGRPDPFSTDGVALLPVRGTVFDNPDAIRRYLESPAAPKRNFAANVRWDTAQMTPSGAFAVVDDLTGTPRVLHGASGAWANPIDQKLGRADLLRYATIIESLPDRNGNVPDWSKSGNELRDSFARLDYEEGPGFVGSSKAALNALTAEKIRTGQWTSPLVKGTLSSGGGKGNNRSREANVKNLRQAVKSKLGFTVGKPGSVDRKTAEVLQGADVLDNVGAPDAAVVLLRRHAAELREQHGELAEQRGSTLLDALADAYLSVYSPQKAPGDRVLSVRPGERVHIAMPPGEGDTDGGLVRTFRVLAPLRTSKYSNESVTTVVDESTGRQSYLKVDLSKVWISDDPDSSPYSARTMADAIVQDRANGRFLITDPGENAPATGDELAQRSRAEIDAIPADVLDAAAEVLPESRPEKAARAASTPPGVRAPRRGSAAAPRRRAQAPAEPAQVRNEDALAVAEGKNVAVLLGMPFELADAPLSTRPHDSVASVRDFLVALDASDPDPRVASSARATLARIDKGQEVLSPGGNFLVSKDGYITHIRSSFTVWPATQGAKDDLMNGGQSGNQAASLKIADALERGSWDGARVDWSQKGPKVVKDVTAIMKKAQFDPTTPAARSAYLAHVLAAPKPKATDLRMLGGMLDSVPDQPMAYPEGLTGARIKAHELGATYELLAGGKVSAARIDHVFAADSKAGSTLAKRIVSEVELAGKLGRVAPLSAVRRLNALADEIGDTKIDGVARAVLPEDGGVAQRREFDPAADLRDLASRITDAFDESKLSPSGSLLRSGWTGNVVLTGEPDVRSLDRFANRLAAEKGVKAKLTDGLRIFVDENGRRHATFSDVDVMDDPADRGQYRRDGAVELGLRGELVVEYNEQSAMFGDREPKRVRIELPAGTWSFEPDAPVEPAPDSPDVAPGVDASADAPDAVPPNEQKVRDAVTRLAGRPGGWVNLSRLRADLTDVDPDELDKTLSDLMLRNDISLIPEANAKTLSDEDHEAAVWIGGEWKHLISIDTPPSGSAENGTE